MEFLFYFIFYLFSALVTLIQKRQLCFIGCFERATAGKFMSDWENRGKETERKTATKIYRWIGQNSGGEVRCRLVR